MVNGLSSRLASLGIYVSSCRPVVTLRFVGIRLIVGFHVFAVFGRVGFYVVAPGLLRTWRVIRGEGTERGKEHDKSKPHFRSVSDGGIHIGPPNGLRDWGS